MIVVISNFLFDIEILKHAKILNKLQISLDLIKLEAKYFISRKAYIFHNDLILGQSFKHKVSAGRRVVLFSAKVETRTQLLKTTGVQPSNTFGIHIGGGKSYFRRNSSVAKKKKRTV